MEWHGAVTVTRNGFQLKAAEAAGAIDRAEANGGAGGRSAPPADHLSENFALLSEFLCSK